MGTRTSTHSKHKARVSSRTHTHACVHARTHTQTWMSCVHVHSHKCTHACEYTRVCMVFCTLFTHECISRVHAHMWWAVQAKDKQVTWAAGAGWLLSLLAISSCLGLNPIHTLMAVRLLNSTQLPLEPKDTSAFHQHRFPFHFLAQPLGKENSWERAGIYTAFGWTQCLERNF